MQLHLGDVPQGGGSASLVGVDVRVGGLGGAGPTRGVGGEMHRASRAVISVHLVVPQSFAALLVAQTLPPYRSAPPVEWKRRKTVFLGSSTGSATFTEDIPRSRRARSRYGPYGLLFVSDALFCTSQVLSAQLGTRGGRKSAFANPTSRINYYCVINVQWAWTSISIRHHDQSNINHHYVRSFCNNWLENPFVILKKFSYHRYRHN